MTSAAPWWQDTVIYQVYLRSFQDSNGDGIGDLPGLASRLDDLRDLGVQAIWITPFFPSPNADFGYDVSDYCDVAPEYGTLADWDALVRQARQRGMRLLVDFVLNHTSDQHPWFREACSSPQHPRRDWYVWRDGPPDGGPPTNWRSVFGGPAWTHEPRSGQWYYHAFLPQQPDLNWHHPGVRAAMADVARFWLRRGASGFRLDATAFLFEDPDWPDDPDPDRQPPWPLQPFNSNRPENHGVLRELRAVLAEFDAGFDDERVLLGESTTDTLTELRAAYGEQGDEIQLPMNFVYARHWQRDAPFFQRLIDDTQALLHDRTPVSFFSNHDHWRQWSAFGDGVHNDAIARLTAAMTLLQRGTALVYYGEEIGMGDLPDAELAAAPLGPSRPRADPRDRARTPMQWDAGTHAGFSLGTPWLPLPRTWGDRHVAAQRADPHSLWHWYRALIALKRDDPALHAGAHWPLHADQSSVLAFGRRSADGTLALVLLNWGEQACEVAVQGLPAGTGPTAEVLLASPPIAAPQRLDRVPLSPFGVAVLRPQGMNA
ncbi:alpha-glucosidase [Ideonella sp. 4Y16]|uniref:alpha-glucosidase n=1 Tax=Ideonella alba TaxID=2824118 RepID=UPI001B39BA20|nr:alpha-glucosidase [Ideonella alba]MBQ0945285.1 alpha-glucosidase [Ideonella alba]